MSPPLAPTSAQTGFVPPSPGLFRFSFDIQGDGFDAGYFDGQAPLEDDGLDDFLQQLVAGITRLDPTLVRPRWQPEPPNLPDYGTDWVAVGAVDHEPDPGWAAWQHDSAGGGRDYVTQSETFVLLTSFYGPHAGAYDGLLRDGLQVGQNREVLQLAGMGLGEVGGTSRVPELIKERWTQRVDRRIHIRRQLLRVYPILNLLGATVSVGVETEGGAVDRETRTVVVAGP